MEVFSEYFQNDHLLSKIDERIKLIVSLTILAMVLSYKGFILPCVVILLCLFLCMKMRIPLKVMMMRLAEPILIVSVILVLKFFFAGNEVLFSFRIFGFEIIGHKDGLWEGLMIGSRVLGAVSIVVLMGFATPFSEFIAALSWLRIPKGFIEILMFAYRYIFVLFEEAGVIYQAQKNRLGYSSLRRGLDSFGILAGSLVMAAFEHSQKITVAMMQRGYDGHLPRLSPKPFNLSEILAGLVVITIMGFVWKM